ncbi:neuronal PAS domain-containing protein 4-like isoform X2 [Megalobrama amblycephala]|nr:neuronal PAS domain-containing protein 4-like isoform X2 [Megalobrama amblycephala]
MSVSCDTSIRRSLRASKRFRSTKGASKARRDHINAEIRTLRALLPIDAEEQERLSYLHSMSLICTFIRKTVLLTGVHEDGSSVSPLNESFLQALPGFIVALTKDGKLVYVSENVVEYLGLSMVDILQGDTFYDMMDSRDAEALKLVLRDPDVSAERSFVCRMLTSKAFRLQYGSCCSMLVKGRFQSSSLFVALCTPTADRLQDRQLLHASGSFHTLHRPDMSLTHAPYSVLFHLGFSAEELIGRSWYDLLHPDDLTLAARCHTTLIRDEGDTSAEMLVRLQRKDLSWIWLYICATTKAAKESIACKNHVISETEAIYLKDKLYGSVSPSVCGAQVSPGPVCLPETAGQMPSRSRRSSETGDVQIRSFFSTPPYSPTSSHSSDFLSEGYGSFEHLVCGSRFCPSEAFPVSQPYPDALPPVCLPDAHRVPVYQPVLDASEGPSDCVLHQEDFMFAQDSVSSLLTPEPSPSADGHFLFSQTEQVEVGTLAHQIRSLASSFSRHTQPDGALCWTPEPLLDERVIDSILCDLDAASAKNTDCVWNGLPVAPGGLSVEPFISATHTNTELHQLHHCLYAGIH